MDFQNRNSEGNKFVCVSDRQLALRAKLRSGWSSSKTTEPLRPEEQAAIISVIQRNEEIESAERQRVGRLIERVEKIKLHARERGPNCCRLCGDSFGFLLRSSRVVCEDCRKPVCSKCSVDINIRFHTVDKVREIWLCRICSETREMWKKSGAWFFKGLPRYEIPCSTSSTPTHPSLLTGSRAATMSEFIAPRRAQSCSATPTRVRVKKLTIRVNDSSSSEDDEQDNNRDAAAVQNQTALSNVAAANVSPPPKMQRGFGSIRSFIEGSGAERRLSSAFFFNRQTASQTPDYDAISTASTIQAGNARRESNHNRRSSISSSWSISDSSSGNSGTTNSIVTSATQNMLTNLASTSSHFRDSLLGWLEVSISYNESSHSLNAVIVRARDLPSMDAGGLTDPYCRLNLITPEAHTKYTRWQRTKTVHKTRNPEFNETIQFVGVEPEELESSQLCVVIFDDDKFGHDFLGMAKISLATVLSNHPYRVSVPLTETDQYSAEAEESEEWPNGKILLSLCYNTKKRALVTNVKQCINLIPMDNNGSSDPFVKLQLKHDTHRNKKYKTTVKWRNLNPIYNEEFFFESSPHDLNKQTLIITVWDKDFGKSNDFLGSLIIGSVSSKGERLQHWYDCIRLPDHFHEKWHCLSNENPCH